MTDRLTWTLTSGHSAFPFLAFVTAYRFSLSIVLQVISQGENIGNGVAVEGKGRQV